MSTSIIELISSLFTNLLFDPVKRQQLADELDEYTKRLYKKTKFTKNLLFRNAPVDLTETYIPLTLRNTSTNVRIINPLQLFEYSNIEIIGPAGCGKTTLFRQIVVTCIDEKIGIPVLVDLRHFDPSRGTFENFLANTLSENFPEGVKKLFARGKFIFLLDGYDEINYTEGADYINQLEKFISKYHSNKFLISSRPGTNIESLNQFYVFNIEPLNENDIELYLDRFTLSSNIRMKLSERIHTDRLLLGILSNPLFLSLYLQYLNVSLEVPHNKSIFFREVFDSLLSKHDSVSKMAYLRERLSGLNKDTLETICCSLAFRSFFSGTHLYSKDQLFQEFEIIKRTIGVNFDSEKLLYDLLITLNILLEEQFHYFFPHVLLLEYLSSLFVTRLDFQQKIQFYSRLLRHSKTILTSGFLEFIYEIDEIAFVKYLAIPVLEESIRNPQVPSSNYLTVVEFLHYVKKKDDANKNIQSNIYTLEVLLQDLKNRISLHENDVSRLFE